LADITALAYWTTASQTPVGWTLQHLGHQSARVELSNRGLPANGGVMSVVDLFTVAVAWTAVGTPGRRCTIDPPEVPVEATMHRHKLDEVKGQLAVPPGNPQAEQVRGYQDPGPLAISVHGWHSTPQIPGPPYEYPSPQKLWVVCPPCLRWVVLPSPRTPSLGPASSLLLLALNNANRSAAK